MKNKVMTLNEYIEYRNMLLMKREARHRHFPEKVTYYDIRLKRLDNQYPEFKGMGKIYKKGI